MSKSRKLIIFLSLCLFFLNSLKKSYAQEVSLGIYPPILQIEATPPTKINTTLNIQNNAIDPITLEVMIKPFTASSQNNGEVSFLSQDKQKKMADPYIFQK